MSVTPDRYFVRAASLKKHGESLRAILEDLRGAGATNFDLIRVVKWTEDARVGAAVRLIEDSGLPDFDASLTFVVPEGDPLYDEAVASFDEQRGQRDSTERD
jgi:hypothetical protein